VSRPGYAREVSRSRGTVSLLALLVGAVAACGGGDTVKGPAPAAPTRIRLSSPAFAAGASIPRRYTCDGAETAPPLRWSKPPAHTRSLALLMEDPDAPGGTFVHWTVYGLAPTATAVPGNPKQGENSFGKRGYSGPCPPKGDKPHRYVFTLYALRSEPKLETGAKPADVRAAIGRAAIGRGRLVGRFGRD
jgi:Raf kinase inhibitor-like YbhB/YbcL family protein